MGWGGASLDRAFVFACVKGNTTVAEVILGIPPAVSPNPPELASRKSSTLPPNPPTFHSSKSRSSSGRLFARSRSLTSFGPRVTDMALEKAWKSTRHDASKRFVLKVTLGRIEPVPGVWRDVWSVVMDYLTSDDSASSPKFAR